MLRYVLAAVITLGYLMLMGMIDERDQRILAMENALSLCVPPEEGEIMHLTKTREGGWECSYSGWKNGQWNLTQGVRL
jgi:hypothetical protein